jgi:hypothetical protein
MDNLEDTPPIFGASDEVQKGNSDTTVSESSPMKRARTEDGHNLEAPTSSILLPATNSNIQQEGVHSKAETENVSVLNEPTASQSQSIPSTSLTYKASGSKRTLHGVIYQLHLLILFLKRGIDNGYSFRLATEMDDAEKFDDVVFQYKEQGNDVIRFLQGKLRQDQAKKITKGDLLNEKDGDFSLQKYFLSYLKICKSLAFRGAEFKDFIIFTNIDLKNEVCDWFVPIVETDPILSMTWKNKQNRKAKLLRIKLPDLQVERKRVLLNSNKVSDVKGLINRLSAIGKASREDVVGFLTKLVVAVNQPNEIELWGIIKSEIGGFHGVSLSNMDLIASEFNKKILDWMKKKEGYFFTHEQGQNLLRGIMQKIFKLMFAGITKDYRIKLDELGIQLKVDHADLSAFLVNANKKQVFNLIVQGQKGRVSFGSLLVQQTMKNCNEIDYSNDDSCIVLSHSSLLRLRTMVKEGFQSTKLLVIEYEDLQAEIIQNLFDDLCAILESHSDKKLVLITHTDDLSKNHFPFKTDRMLRDRYEEKTVKFSFTDLTTMSQDQLLQQSVVRFQGKPMSFADLVREYGEQLKHAIDGEMIYKITNNEEITIGKPLTGLGEEKGYYIPRVLRRAVQIKPEIEKSSSFIIVKNISDASKLQLSKPELQKKAIVLISNSLKDFVQLQDEKKYTE